MHNLSGSGSLDFANGRLKGIDFGKVGRAIQGMLGAKGPSEAFTDYSALDASFRIANGVLSSGDLKLQSPLIETTGSGTVDLGNRTIDFRIVPTASASFGGGKTVKIGVPFNIQGPWKHVRTKADVGSLVSGVIDNLASGKAPFKGLLGGKPDAKPLAPTDPNAPKKKKHKNLDEALKNMLGIH
jgi:AsmA protein